MHDTSSDAQAVQDAVYRRMTGEQKLRIAIQMSEAVRETAKQRIRQQHPDFNEQAVIDELVWELYGIRRNS